jgi:hypothetical protein
MIIIVDDCVLVETGNAGEISKILTIKQMKIPWMSCK